MYSLFSVPLRAAASLTYVLYMGILMTSWRSRRTVGDLLILEILQESQICLREICEEEAKISCSDPSLPPDAEATQQPSAPLARSLAHSLALRV